MKNTRKTLTIALLMAAFGGSAWMIGFALPGASKPTDFDEEDPIEMEKPLGRLSKEAKATLQQLNNVQWGLDHYSVVNEETIREVGDPMEDAQEVGRRTISKSGKRIRIEREGLLKIQDEDISVTVVPEEKVIVLQDPDKSFLDMIKLAPTYFNLDSIQYDITKSKVEILTDGLGRLTVEMADAVYDKVTITYDPKTYIIKYIERYGLSEDEEGGWYNTISRTTLTYTFSDKKKISKMFNIENIVASAGKNNYLPAKGYIGFEVHNSTLKQLKKTLN